MVNITYYEALSLQAITQWEQRGHTGLNKRLLDLASKPIGSAISVLEPETIHAVENIVHRGVQRLLHGSQFSMDANKLVKRARAQGIRLRGFDDIKRISLMALDRCNRRHVKIHGRGACLIGAVAGLGGPLLAAADLTALLWTNFHLIQEVAFCYGFDPNDAVEKQIMLRVLLAGFGSSEMKAKALEEIEALEARLELQRSGADHVSLLGSRALASYVEHLTVALLTRIVPHALPVVSVVLAAHNNHETVNQIGRTAFMVYRRRFVERKRAL